MTGYFFEAPLTKINEALAQNVKAFIIEMQINNVKVRSWW